MKSKTKLHRLLVLAGSTLLTVSSASAATVNWEGDVSNLWGTAGNWDSAPANSLTADIANFNLATYGGNPIFAPTVGIATSINGITIGAGNGTMTLTNTAALSIGGSGISIASGAGAFTISGSTTLGAAQSWTNNSANLFTIGAVTNGANLLTIGGSGNTTASGVIGNGAGGLTKEGGGLLTLNAANTFTGTTTVNAGELRWGITNALSSGNLTVNSGGAVNMQNFNDTVGTITIAQGGTISGTTGTFTTGSLISNNGGTMTGATLVLSNNGSVNYNSTGPGSSTFQIEKLSVNDSGTNVFDIADGAAAVDFDITGFVNNGGNNVSRTITKTGAGAMQFSGGTLGAAGQNGVSLNINEGTVLMNRATGVAFIPGSSLTITVGDSAGSAGSANLKFAATGGDNQLGNRPITINSDGLFDLNGKTQNTSGALTLNSTGELQLNNGSLTVGSVTINPSAGNTTILSLGASGTLTLGGDVTLNALGSGRAQITGSALSLGAANRIFNIGLGSAADYDLVVGAGITGARSLTKIGSGRLILTGTNNYTLGTIVNAGTLQIGDGTTAGTMTSSGALTLGNATFAVRGPASGGSSQTVASLATTASTGSTIRLTPGTSGNTTLTITSGTPSTGAGSSLNFDYTAGTTVGGTVGNNSAVWSPTLTAGIIGGAYTVTDSGGTGFATRNGANVVRLTDPGSAGLLVSGGSATGSYFVNSSYSTDTTTTPGSLVQALSGAVAASNVTVNTTGLTTGANLALGTNLLTLGAGMVFDGPNAYEITGSGAGGLRAASAGGTINLYNANTSTVTISAPIVNNSASRLTIDGPGTTILSGVNTYTGATVVNGGTVRFSGTMAASPITINNGVAQLGTATSLTSSNTITFGAGSTGSLQLLGNNLTIGALNSNTTTPGAPVITNNNVANATLTLDSGSSTTIGGVIQDGSGGGTLALNKSGGGTLTLSGVNTYSGGTTINAGAVSVTSDANLGNASGGITLNGGRLTIASVNLNTTRNITVTGTGSSIVVNLNNNFTTSGALLGSGAITFLNPGGSGTPALYRFTSSGSTYTGAMTVQNLTDVRVSSLGDVASNNIIFTGAGSFSLNDTGATTGLSFNNRAIELSNSSGTVSNLNATHAITIGSNLVATGAGAKVLTLGAVAGPTNVFSGIISDGTGGGTVGITTSGAGTWMLSNSANTYTGTTTIGGGTLIINTLTSGNIIFPRSAVGTLISVGSGGTTNGTIRLEDDVSNRNSGSGIFNNGTGALIFNGGTFNTPFVSAGNTGHTPTLILGGTFAGSANEVRGVIADNELSSNSRFAITKNADTSIWQFSGANTYSGGNTISGGTLRGTQTSGTPFGTGAVTLNAGILSLAPTGSGSAVSVTGGTRASGTAFTYNPGAMLSLARGSQNSLTYTFGGGGTVWTRGANGTHILSTSDIANFGASGSKTERFLVNGTAPAVVNTIVSGVVIQDRNSSNAGDFATYDATDGFTKAAYTHTNTFSGSTNVSRVEITSATSTGNISSYAIKANATVTNSGTITLGSSGNPAALILNGGSISGGTLAAASGNPEFLIYTSGTSSISSAITSTNTGMSVFGPGSLTLSSSNSFTGGLRVNNSTLIVTNDNQLGGANNALTLRGGTLQTSGASLAIGAGARAITLAVGQDQTGGTFDVTSGTTTFQNNSTGSRIISGSGSLTKTGAGILELSGNTTNTYTGQTRIADGTLKLGANDVLPNGSAVSIGTATLDADTRTDTVGTLDVTGSAVINLGSGAALVFANSSAFGTGTWAGTLNLVGFVSGSSLNFGSPAGLTAAQLSKISATGFSNFSLDAEGDLIADFGGGDTTPPSLTSINDDKSGGPVDINTPITYTVTFSEDINASTVSDLDFGNAGTAPITIGAITETSPGVFTVVVTPTNSGSVQLRINQGAVIEDTATIPNALVTTSALLDNTTITVRTIYESWANTNSSTGGKAGDPDGDGYNNLMEFAFDTNPTTNSAASIAYSGGVVTAHGQPILVQESGIYYAVFGRRVNYVAAGLVYTVEFSAGLDQWTSSATGLTTVATDGVIDAIRIPFPNMVPTPSGPMKPTFFRVLISEQ